MRASTERKKRECREMWSCSGQHPVLTQYGVIEHLRIIFEHVDPFVSPHLAPCTTSELAGQLAELPSVVIVAVLTVAPS
jgi:hypothetical protein